MRLRTQIGSVLVAVGLLATIVTGGLAYVVGRESLQTEAFDRLTAIRELKRQQIEDFFQRVNGQILTLASNLMLVEALNEFQRAFESFPEALAGETRFADELLGYYQNEFSRNLLQGQARGHDSEALLPRSGKGLALQHRYIAANPHPLGSKDRLLKTRHADRYGQAHQIYHPILRNFVRQFGYYDLFLVNGEGDVVYSVFKEIDFATNLISGPHRQSNLSRAFRKAWDSVQGDAVTVIDFDRYLPSQGAPAAFVAFPIFNETETKVGVLVFQLPIDHINAVMTGGGKWSAQGLGNTGQTYLVAEDFTMRNDARALIESPGESLRALEVLGLPRDQMEQIRHFKTTILLQDVRTRAVLDALNGITDTRITTDYRGVPVLSAYSPLDLHGMSWVILSEIEVQEVFAPVRRLTSWVVGTVLAVALLALALAIGFSNRLNRPVSLLLKGFESLERGERGVIVHATGDDEIGQLVTGFNHMASNLYETTVSYEELEIVEAKERAVIESVAEGIVTCDLQGTVLSANKAVETIFGHDRDYLVGRNIKLLMPETLASQHDAYLNKYRRTGERHVVGNSRQVTGLHRDGREFPLELRVTEVPMGKQRLLVGSLRDLSETLSAQQEIEKVNERLQKNLAELEVEKQLQEEQANKLARLVQEQARLRDRAEEGEARTKIILNTVTDGIVTVGADGKILSFNVGAERMFGLLEQEAIGHPLSSLVVSPEGDEREAHVIAYLQERVGDRGDRDFYARPVRGDDFPVELDVNEMWLGGVRHFVCVLHDVTEQRKAEAEIRKLATTDTLTGLTNRDRFEKRLRESLALSARTNTPVGLAMLDLDRFKPINDTYGHPVGDAVLQHVAKIISEECREVDVSARLGGDEFAIAFNGLAKSEDVMIPARRIVERVAKPFSVMGETLNVGVSIGVAFGPAHGDSTETLTRNADAALYEAKRAGRGAIHTFTPETAPRLEGISNKP